MKALRVGFSLGSTTPQNDGFLVMTVSIIPSYGEGWCNVFRDGHLEKIA